MRLARQAASLGALFVALALSVLAPGAAAATGRTQQFSLGEGVHASALTIGPEGNLWFVGGSLLSGADVVGNVTPDGHVTEFTGSRAGSGLTSIAAGPDGHLFFTETGANRIGRITTAGQSDGIALPIAGSRPSGIVAGPEGDIWFSEEGTGRVGRVDDATQTLREYALPAGSRPIGIAVDAEGNLWVAENGTDEIAQIAPSGRIVEIPVPFASSRPSGIVAGPEGDIWFSEEGGPWLGRITSLVGTSGEYERFNVFGNKGTQMIVNGPHGDFWFTAGNTIGSISPRGVLGEPACVSRDCKLPVTALAEGPEGALWFATGPRAGEEESAAGTIGKFLPPRLSIRIGAKAGPLKGRDASLRLICAGGAAGDYCDGVVRVSAVAATGSRPKVLGERSYRFHAVTDRQIKVPIGRRAAKLVAAQGRLAVRVTVTLSGGKTRSRELILPEPA